MFHVLFYVRPFAFPRWAIRVFQAFQAFWVIRVIWFFRFFRFIRTMLRAAIWHEKRG